MGMIEQLISLLHSDHTTFHEHLMSGLVTIVNDHARSIEACQQPELQFEQLLRRRLDEIGEKEEFLVRLEIAVLQLFQNHRNRRIHREIHSKPFSRDNSAVMSDIRLTNVSVDWNREICYSRYPL